MLRPTECSVSWEALCIFSPFLLCLNWFEMLRCLTIRVRDIPVTPCVFVVVVVVTECNVRDTKIFGLKK